VVEKPTRARQSTLKFAAVLRVELRLHLKRTYVAQSCRAFRLQESPGRNRGSL